MNKQEYKETIEELTEYRRDIADGKRRDYTRDSKTNVLKNFYNQAEALGISPETSLAVHLEKQFSAVLTWIKTDGDSESEPIKNRISDCLNYLELLWGIIEHERPKDFNAREIDTDELIPSEKKCCGQPDTCDIRSCSENDHTYYQEGDKVEVIKHGTHNFGIGEIITLKKKFRPGEGYEHWKGENENGDSWYIFEDEFKPAKETKRSFGI